MSSVSSFLRRAAVVGLAFAAASAPSVAGAGTVDQSTVTAAAVPTVPVVPFQATIGPVTVWAIAPYAAGFSGPGISCHYQVVESIILPPGAYCYTSNGHSFAVAFPVGGLPVFFIS